MRALFVIAALSLGACTATAPAPAPETVGALVDTGSSIASAPVHETTDLSGGFQAVDSDDEPVSVAAAPAVVEAPDVAAKGGGMRAGEVR